MEEAEKAMAASLSHRRSNPDRRKRRTRGGGGGSGRRAKPRNPPIGSPLAGIASFASEGSVSDDWSRQSDDGQGLASPGGRGGDQEVEDTMVPKLPPIGAATAGRPKAVRPSSREYRVMLGQPATEGDGRVSSTMAASSPGCDHGVRTAALRPTGSGGLWRSSSSLDVDTGSQQRFEEFNSMQVNTLSPLDELSSRQGMSAGGVKVSSRLSPADAGSSSQVRKHKPRVVTPRQRSVSGASAGTAASSGSRGEANGWDTGEQPAVRLVQHGSSSSRWRSARHTDRSEFGEFA